MAKTRLTMMILMGALLGACGGGGGDAEATEDEATTSGDEGAADAETTCVAFMTRQRECQAEYLPGLVALRVRLDRPAGIAARDGAEGRDALLAEATAEYANDSMDDAIAARCQGILADVPTEEIAGMTQGMQGCIESADCAAYSQCDLAMLEQHWASTPEAQ